ncbi:hypothetical protein [Burkholderia ubonensis]|uniref:hypothetical protein n=1 Tax=Burkholderia ubonensis TaxID=101571 RepID=UPI00075E3903|nr:hypothetical protein [Burkholderia ubonensis]AOI74485.1 hypothetical protein WI31_34620 [Burkholderia ubonensis]KUZ23926.1 hypothetical protein WI29_09700 [Burkholderia ubonensis]KUZ32710.1 hypothetical protein WI30_15675 [Burkholderia ubonensis]KUZ34944.1 hypothetical protein WI32_16255 [Burkholderia ubonensis]KUZ52905.1 hypothetical protein WI33_10670 [Burkholderia ubonensis]
MIAWRAFTFAGVDYDLSHLHPCQIEFVQPAKGKHPARTYVVQLIFGLHCFTRSAEPGEAIDPARLYSDARETRVFCERRYRLSMMLPAIVDGLAVRPCYHTGKGNFFVMEAVDEQGAVQEYEVYFTASRATKRGVLNLFVQSAYVRDRSHKGNRPKRKPIRLHVILHNTLINRPIKEPVY